MKDQRKLWEVLVPVTDRLGMTFTVSFHQRWDQRITALVGGLSIHHPIKGRWRGADAQVAEEMIPVRIVATYAQMLDVVKLTAEHYNQKAVLAYKVSDEVLLYEC